MQFMLMCCIDEKKWNGLPAEKRDTIMQEYHGLMQSLKASGHLMSGAKLDDCSTAVTVRQASVTDGPFAETKEQLGGYHVIECENQDEAVAIAQRIPTLPSGGTIEVRRLLYAE
ncbi:MAG: YciI family protein [Planctomycetota bacterium]|nr:MAG: YciI family protein [Planctomycetota bacterium]